MRLEKHLEKLREQYKAQKDEEETKRQFYHSPETARREGVEDEGDESSEGQLDGSMELSTQSEQTPEPSPALNQRERAGNDVAHPLGQRVLPEPAPKPKVAPQVAPRPSKAAPQANGGSVAITSSPAYNPYPAPTQAAPRSPIQVERNPSPQQPAPLPPQPVATPVAPPIAPPTAPPLSPGSDKEAMFAFAWYHGSISRDEALHRLEGVGGFDG